MSKTDSSLFLHFLGNGAAFNPAFGNTSAYIQDEKRLFLLDCGETVFSRLTDQHILNSSQDIYAAVSHLHCDHAGSLGSLILYCYYGLHSPMTLVIPDNCDQYVKQIMSLLRFMGVSDDKYHLLSAEQLNFFKPFTSFSYIPTRHDPSMFCFSFTFDTPAGGVRPA